LTMARYYTPAGINIDHVGVTPDIVVQEPELSEAEQDAYRRIREDRRVISFVERVGEPSESDIQSFIEGLRADGIDLNERYIRRLVRIEVNRVLNRSEIYDLEYDLVLQRAMEFLSGSDQ